MKKIVIFICAMMSLCIPFCHGHANMERHVGALAQKYHLHPMDVDNLELKFQVHGPLSKGEIRKILINLYCDCLERTNADVELYELLKNDPLAISISLFPVDAAGKSLYDPNIGKATISQGTLSYWIVEGAQPESEESYAEALSALDQHPKNEKHAEVEQHSPLDEIVMDETSQKSIHLDVIKY